MRRPALALAALVPAALALFALATGPAAAQSAAVRSACSGDYHRFCPAYPVGSTQLRSCMRSVGKRLSPSCVNALVDSGEISRKDVKKYRN